MAKLSIEGVKKIRDAMQASVILREGGYRAKVNFCLGTCGIAAGARKVMTALMDEISAREVKDVIILTSGCAGKCNLEPMMTVETPGVPPVQYVQLNIDKMKEIFTEHILGGKKVEKYALAAETEKTP
jgi:NADP-reducing hydrogenase subunit HndB